MQLQWIGNLPALPPDPGNRYADNPKAAALGQKLFFDTRYSAGGTLSCATCHVPELSFTDGLAKARGVGEASRGSPSLLGIAHSPWFFWDGRSDSLWSQSLGPLESEVEHGGNRYQYARILFRDDSYRKMYEEIFGPLPDLSDSNRFPRGTSNLSDLSEADRKAVTRIFVNMGKAIAAYERLLMPGPSRFDRYVEAVLAGTSSETDILSDNELAGMKLFFGKAMCITCHQGPLFTNHGFHNIGVRNPDADQWSSLPLFRMVRDSADIDVGRYHGVQEALKSEFNCLSEYSDAKEEDCGELRFANTRYPDTLGAFKVPTLRNIAKTAPYMHAGQFADLPKVLEHYNKAPQAPSGHSELLPLDLSATELHQLESFLNSLDSPPDVPPALLRQPSG